MFEICEIAGRYGRAVNASYRCNLGVWLLDRVAYFFAPGDDEREFSRCRSIEGQHTAREDALEHARRGPFKLSLAMPFGHEFEPKKNFRLSDRGRV